MAVLLLLALLGALVVGLVLGLVWRGLVLVGDRRTLDRLASELTAEYRMAAATQATLGAMRAAAQDAELRQRRTGRIRQDES